MFDFCVKRISGISERTSTRCPGPAAALRTRDTCPVQRGGRAAQASSSRARKRPVSSRAGTTGTSSRLRKGRRGGEVAEAQPRALVAAVQGSGEMTGRERGARAGRFDPATVPVRRNVVVWE